MDYFVLIAGYPKLKVISRDVFKILHESELDLILFQTDKIQFLKQTDKTPSTESGVRIRVKKVPVFLLTSFEDNIVFTDELYLDHLQACTGGIYVKILQEGQEETYIPDSDGTCNCEMHAGTTLLGQEIKVKRLKDRYLFFVVPNE